MLLLLGDGFEGVLGADQDEAADDDDEEAGDAG